MEKPVLVIMAAGMGSRYGGLKQIDPVDEQGNKIIDFSIYDAKRAGFEKVIFIIKKEMEQDFRTLVGDRISRYMKVQYVFQDMQRVPEGFQIPKEREKPWGTAHAVLCCKDIIKEPFAVINADDFYGLEAFRVLYEFLATCTDDNKYRYAMVGYELKNTLTEYGYVARGCCTVDKQGYLVDIVERTRIEKRGDCAAYTEDGEHFVPIPLDMTVSMNTWAFTPSILAELEAASKLFFETKVKENPLKAEYFLPMEVGRLLQEKKATVKVLPSSDKWFGVTYKEDKAFVVESIKKLKQAGVYPEQLWN